MRGMIHIALLWLVAACQGVPPGQSQRAGTFVPGAKLQGVSACRDPLRGEALVGGDPTTRARRIGFRDLLLGGHCIADGNNVILHFGAMMPGPSNTTDASEFLLLTVELPNLPQIGERLSVPAETLHTYFSQGAAAWVEKGSGVFGKQARGRLEITYASENELVVSGHLSIEAKDARDDAMELTAVAIHDRFRRVRLEELRRCLGYNLCL